MALLSLIRTDCFMLLNGFDSSDIQLAARLLANGQLVSFPTETVYGLGADANNDQAVAAVFAVKHRPINHPLIVHIAAVKEVDFFAHSIPEFAKRLMDRFWPGPLTLVLPRNQGVAGACSGQQSSIGLRMPSHPVCIELLKTGRRFGVHGVAGPSANQFGRVSPTTAEHVIAEFGSGMAVLNGGACDVGIESALNDCSREVPVLLRPGILTLEQLSLACGQPVLTPGLYASQSKSQAPSPRASGTLASHYAPNASLRLYETPRLLEMARNYQPSQNEKLAIWSRTSMPETGSWVHQTMPSEPEACAQQLFALLRHWEENGITVIWIEQVPNTSEWAGISDRLTRASN